MADTFYIEKTGVAIGQASTGTEDEKLFEVNYPANFSAPVTAVNAKLSNAWTPLTLASGVTVSANNQWQYRGAGYRVEGGHHVIIAISVAFTGKSSSYTLASGIPSEYCPTNTVFSFNPLNVTTTTATYGARLYVSAAGNVGLSYVCDGTSSTASTSSFTQVHGLLEYWI